VTNCDIIVETDYSELVKHHFQRENDISLVASVKQYCIPYGICTMEDGGMLVGIEEKPEYDFLVNTGMYVMDASVLKLIPDNEVFHMTDLIGRVKNTGGRVGVYPVSERSWVDTGQWVEYKKAVEKMGV
jgi:NDP-sugar pyrophosphorylase family protein